MSLTIFGDHIGARDQFKFVRKTSCILDLQFFFFDELRFFYYFLEQNFLFAQDIKTRVILEIEVSFHQPLKIFSIGVTLNNGPDLFQTFVMSFIEDPVAYILSEFDSE